MKSPPLCKKMNGMNERKRKLYDLWALSPHWMMCRQYTYATSSKYIELHNDSGIDAAVQD
jgi:hypothetical protein